MSAIIHPGAVIHCWDHLVITLRDGATETGFLSLYAITYSASLGPGHVAIVDIGPGGAGGLSAIYADPLDLGARQKKRLNSMGGGSAALATVPIQATFERQPYGPDGFGFRISAHDHEIETRWESTEPPFWVDGQGGGFHDSEDIWALMVGAQQARLIVDGRETPGEPFEDDVWLPKLGRTLSSAHGAFAEVRVEPVNGRATGTGPGGPR